MKGKRLLDLTLTGDSREGSGSYYGSTLTTLVGDSRPGKASVRSLECTRLTPRGSSRTHSARSSIVSHGTSAVSSRLTSRATSAVSHGTSVISRGTGTKSRRRSQITSNGSSILPGVFSGASSSLTDLCQMGLTVWRVENQNVHQVGLKEHGFFHQGNSYVVLQIEGEDSHSLHTWYGSQSNKSDREAARAYAEEVDKSLDGATFMSIECEGYETSTFLSHFRDGIVIVEGKSKQQLVKAYKYTKRLYVVTGRRYPTATCVECCTSAAQPNSALILDGYPRLYVWLGEQTDFVHRVKAIGLARKMRTWQRNGKGHIIVIESKDKQMSEAFLRKLESNKSCDIPSSQTLDENEIKNTWSLYRINGDRVLYDMPLVQRRPLQQKYLTSMDCFLLDNAPAQPVYVWVGNGADSESLYGALHNAQTFTQHHVYPATTALCRITEGDEPIKFKTAFADWRDRAVKERQLIRSYNVANIGRALFSRSDRRTVAKLAEAWSDDQFVSGEGETQMWQVDGEILIPRSCDQLGVFYNWHCYIFLYSENISGAQQSVIYYWLGKRTDIAEQQQAQKLAVSMNAALGHRTAVMRVLDGQEPMHFLTVLGRSIIVYDADLRQDTLQHNNFNCSRNANMYSVREVAAGCMRVSQVPPLSSNLNSSAAFVVIEDDTAFLWYGKNATAYEREYSKTVHAYFSPDRSFDYDILTEGREPATFWATISYIGKHPQEFPKPRLERRAPTLSLCTNKMGRWHFTDVPDFSQEDLCESDMYILDSHDQIQLWSGTAVPDRDQMFSQVVQAYIVDDPAERSESELKIWYCNQNNELSIFTKYFRGWDQHGYGGEVAYQAARKRLRQENAKIDIDCQMIDTTYMNTIKVSYKELVKGENLPNSIDNQHKEHHLSDKEFTRVLRMTRAQFYRLPEWKQQQILRSARLVPSTIDCMSTLSPDTDSYRL